MVGRRIMTVPTFWLQLLFCWCLFLCQAQGFSANVPSSSSSSSESNFHDNPNKDHDHLLTFSPQSFARSQALETAQALDASRFHFSILFVDQDNVLGRLAESLLERIAEYNDALFQIFPASATLEGGPVDASPPASAISTGQAWGLCETTLTAIGSAFDANECLSQYDLIIATNEHIRAKILQQATPDDTVALQCRTLADFCQWHDFSSSIGNNNKQNRFLDKRNNNNPPAPQTPPHLPPTKHSSTCWNRIYTIVWHPSFLCWHNTRTNTTVSFIRLPPRWNMLLTTRTTTKQKPWSF